MRPLPVALFVSLSAACGFRSPDSRTATVTLTDATALTACQRLSSVAGRTELKFSADTIMPAGCQADANGGWAILQRPVGDKISHYAQLVHVANDGTIVKIALDNQLTTIRLSAADVGTLDAAIPRIRRVYDFDHDGIGEVWLHVTDDTFGVQADTLLTIKGGKVVPYAPTNRFTTFELQDVDKDGIPDLAFRFLIEGGGDVCGAPNAGKYSLPLFGHAKADGTFAFDDALAQKYARQACPAKPTGAPKSTKGQDVICGRVWGAAPATFAHFDQDARACEASLKKMTGDDRPCEKEPECAQLRMYVELAKTIPDVGLTATP